MSTYSMGDLAQSFLLQRRGFALKSEMARLTDELASGQVSDVKAVLAGNHGYLNSIEKDMRLLDSYRVAAIEAAQHSEAMQNAMDRVQTSSAELSTSLLTLSGTSGDTMLEQGSTEAVARLEEMIGALNGDLAGRNLFSGVDTDTSPLAGVDVLLAGLRAAVAGATTSDDVLLAAQTWFDDPAGFAATVYRGSDTGLAPLRISDSEQVSIDIKANDKTFRAILQHAAVAAIANDSGFVLPQEERRALLLQSGDALLGDQHDLTATRAGLGAAEARIGQVQARNSSEQTALEIARNSLLAADPFETATRLEEVQFQLQALYTITAKMSDLSLVNFLR